MSSIRVVSPGLQSTVQDLGRFRWAGNLLVGNAENAAAIQFEAHTVIALAGFEFSVSLRESVTACASLRRCGGE